MKTRNRTVAAAVSLALAVSSFVVSSTPAQAKPTRAQYVHGSAVAFAPVYSSSLGGYQYKCAFAGWVQVTVDWTCELYAPVYGWTLAQHSGSFSSGSANPGWFFYPKAYGVTTVCTVAWAGYANGSDQASSTACV